jgi:hypothetical protein
MPERVTAQALDFTKVKDRGPINPIHQAEGDYRALVKGVQDITMGDTKRPAWMFIITVGKGNYPYRCGFNENELWKIRNLFVACGFPVPKKRLKVDPTKVVGRALAVSLEDHEYDGKLSSQIGATFPVTELEGDDGEEPDEEEEGEAEEETEEEPEEEAEEEEAEADEDELEALDIEDL